MQLNDTRISRHENPDLLKIEFFGEEDAVLVSMRGEGVHDLSDEQAVGRARRVIAGMMDETPALRTGRPEKAGTDQTLGRP
jgi:hypothetical protein